MQYIFSFDRCQRQMRGVSLVEALVTLSIAAILSALAAPPLGQLLAQFRESSMANAFTASVHRTRNEAIHRNARVVMCKSANGQFCSTTGSWEQGWIIFHDANANLRQDADEVPLEVQLFASGKIRLWGNGPVADYIAFTGLGLPQLTTGNFQAGSLYLCTQSAQPVQGSKLSLSKIGNFRSAKMAFELCE